MKSNYNCEIPNLKWDLVLQYWDFYLDFNPISMNVEKEKSS
jgi:hypothetical protein